MASSLPSGWRTSEQGLRLRVVAAGETELAQAADRDGGFHAVRAELRLAEREGFGERRPGPGEVTGDHQQGTQVVQALRHGGITRAEGAPPQV
jgi:hypothetical protein